VGTVSSACSFDMFVPSLGRTNIPRGGDGPGSGR